MQVAADPLFSAKVAQLRRDSASVGQLRVRAAKRGPAPRRQAKGERSSSSLATRDQRVTDPIRRDIDHLLAKAVRRRRKASGFKRSRMRRNRRRHTGQSLPCWGQASDLAITLLSDSGNPTYEAPAHRTIMAPIKGYIDQSHSDPSLTPEDIAAAVNISTRYLHKLFKSEHQTVALHLRSITYSTRAMSCSIPDTPIAASPISPTMADSETSADSIAPSKPPTAATQATSDEQRARQRLSTAPHLRDHRMNSQTHPKERGRISEHDHGRARLALEAGQCHKSNSCAGSRALDTTATSWTSTRRPLKRGSSSHCCPAPGPTAAAWVGCCSPSAPTRSSTSTMELPRLSRLPRDSVASRARRSGSPIRLVISRPGYGVFAPLVLPDCTAIRAVAV
jgi:AraC-like DNA-binding protein